MTGPTLDDDGAPVGETSGARTPAEPLEDGTDVTDEIADVDAERETIREDPACASEAFAIEGDRAEHETGGG